MPSSGWSKVRVYESAVRAHLTENGDIGRKVTKVLRQTANTAKTLSPVDSGNLRASVNQDLTVSGGRLVGRVYADAPYARYVHDGTGIYNGGKPIRPKRAKVLAFRPKGAKAMVYTQQVRGQKPNRFLLNAAKQTFPWPVQER